MNYNYINEIAVFLANEKLAWHDWQDSGIQYWHPECLQYYIIRYHVNYDYVYGFVMANSPSEACNKFLCCGGTQEKIKNKCEELKSLLLAKNRKYGNSALEPCRIFSRANAVEQILVRIDDKLNRIKNRQDDEDEDVIMDLAGYLILLMIAREKEGEK